MSDTIEHFGEEQKPDMSVIIISYNTCALTLRAVEAVFEQKGPMVEVIVVDNASSDGSASALAQNWPQVKLIALQRNLGFARACNLGAGFARGRFLCFLNSDAYPTPGALAAILDFAQRWPNARVWGGRALHPDGNLNPRSCACRPTLWSVISRAAGLSALCPDSAFFNPEAMPGWYRNDERHVDVVIGHFLLIEHTEWMRLGGFDPAYFMYGEDIDLCLRAARLGAKPAITPNAEVVHDEGSSQSQAPRSAQILAARIRYTGRHLPKNQQWIAIWSIRVGVGLRLLIYGATCPFFSCKGHFHRLYQIWKMRNLWWHGYPESAGLIEQKTETYFKG